MKINLTLRHYWHTLRGEHWPNTHPYDWLDGSGPMGKLSVLVRLLHMPSARMRGCQSTNHDQCYGALWQCSACGKLVCYAEGTDDHPELCDDCWVSTYHALPVASNQEVS